FYFLISAEFKMASSNDAGSTDQQGDDVPLLRHPHIVVSQNTVDAGSEDAAESADATPESAVFEEPSSPSAPKRWRYVEKEILETEQSYLADMSKLAESFLMQPLGKEFPTEKVLLNLNEVCEASRSLLADLEAVANDNTDASGSRDIGQVFIKHGDRIATAYVPFCRGVKSAIKRAESLQSQSSPLADKIAERMNSLAPDSGFQLDSFLIKPLQRITRYPLLLRELLKQGCPYPQSVSQASEIITNTLRRVNEEVRVHELLSRYLTPADWQQQQPQRARWDSLVHTLDKKGGRWGTFVQERLSGHVSATADPKLRHQVGRFIACRQLVDTVLQQCGRLGRKTQRCVQSLAALHRQLANFSPAVAAEAPWPEAALLDEGADGRWGRFTSDAEKLVFEPLRSLQDCFSGPQRLIDACERKRLDYERVLRRSQPDPMAEDAARQDFAALSGRLKEELPDLISLSIQLLVRSVVCFLRLLQSASTQARLLLKEAFPSDSCELTPLIEQELDAWLQRLAALPTLAEASLLQEVDEESAADGGGGDEDAADSASPATPGFRPASAIRQSDELRQRLVGKYKMSQLRRVVREHLGCSAKREVDACQGDLVAVLMASYPSRTSHSLVDTGSASGLLPAELLSTRELASALPKPEKQPATIWYVDPEQVFSHLLHLPPSYDDSTRTAAPRKPTRAPARAPT
ncbi:hypothetical protein BOX15_Mlig025508g2, partial [Macrostomum lignano]